MDTLSWDFSVQFAIGKSSVPLYPKTLLEDEDQGGSGCGDREVELCDVHTVDTTLSLEQLGGKDRLSMVGGNNRGATYYRVAPCSIS